MPSEGAVDVTVIVNCHKEGILSFPSLRSLARSRTYAEARGVSVETVLIADSADASTLEALNRFRAESSLKIDEIFRVQLGDLGLARNAGVAKARGRYIAFLDADDLFSENWIQAAYSFAESRNEKLVLHPEINVCFGREHCWWRHIEQARPLFDPSQLVTQNFWTALSFVHRSAIDENLYQEARVGSGFGYEDWHWNCNAIDQGWRHCPVPRTAHFIRLKEFGSMSADHGRMQALVRPSRLFLRKDLLCEEQSIRAFKYSLIAALKFVLPKSWRAYLNRIRQRKRRRMPDWVGNELELIRRIEPSIGPLKSFNYHDRTSWSQAGRLYARILAELEFSPKTFSDIVFAAVAKGEPYVRALKGQVLLIITDDSEPTQGAPLPQNVKCLNLARLGRGVQFEDTLVALTRLLLQAQPETVHNLDSRQGWEILKRFAQSLSQYSRLVSSVPDTPPHEEALRVCYPYLSVHSNDGRRIKVLQETYGFPDDLFRLGGSR